MHPLHTPRANNASQLEPSDPDKSPSMAGNFSSARVWRVCPGVTASISPANELVKQMTFISFAWPILRHFNPLPKRVLHRVRSNPSSFNFKCPLFPLGHAVAAYVFFFVFSSLLPFLQYNSTPNPKFVLTFRGNRRRPTSG